MKKRYLIAALAIFFAAPAFGEDEFKDEIYRYMLEPCRLVITRRQDLDSRVNYRQALDFIEAMQPEVSRNVIDTLSPMLRGKSFDRRLALYNTALLACLGGAGVE